MTTRLLMMLMAAALFTAPACRNKKLADSRNVRTEQLDTVHIVAAKPDSRPVYRGTNPLPNDIIHTRLEVSFDWQRSRLNGTATLQVRPYFYPVNNLVLNAKGMEIKSVDILELPVMMEATGATLAVTGDWRRRDDASFKYDNDSLRIYLGRIFDRREVYQAVISYVAKPDELQSPGGSAAITEDKGLYFINPRAENPFRMPQIWTQGETQSSSVWFPTIDSPNEKMTQEIFITVDDKYTTLSNGQLVSSEKKPGGLRTDHWKLERPHAPYLAMMAVGQFEKIVDEPWNGKEISYYVEKEYAPFARAIFGETKQMIDFYSKALNFPYPWEKYSQVVVREYVSGAMENTSATLHGDFMVYQTDREISDRLKSTAVVAHELFHQWFGNVVTCESWSNLPLNESFATYGEYLWYENRYGREAADEHLWYSRQGYVNSRQEADMIRYHYRDKEEMFDVISYNKGGQVMHMLRKAVGDEAFFAGLSKYINDNQFKPVEIHHLRLAFEAVTGRDLNWFFNQWFLSSGRPSLRIRKQYDEPNRRIVLIAEQRQDLSKTPLYRLPLLVDVYSADSVRRVPIVIKQRLDTFFIPFSSWPQFVNFDSERQLIADLDYERSTKDLVFQYQRCPLFIDRMDALEKLAPLINDSLVFQVFRAAALSDKNATIRQYAISRLEKTSPSYAHDLKDLLIQSFQSDESGMVRGLALGALNRRFLNDPQVISISDGAFRDRSYIVNAEALTYQARRDPSQAVKSAMSLQKEKGRDIIIAVAAVYANHGGDGHIGYFRESIPYVSGTDMMNFCMYYARLGARCGMPGSVLTVASDLEAIGKGASRYTRMGVSRALKELLALYDQKEAALRHKTEGSKASPEASRHLQETSDVLAKLRTIYERTRS